MRLARRPYQLGHWEHLAGDLADYVGRTGLSGEQLRVLVANIESHVERDGPFRTVADFWTWLDLYRVARFGPQPHAQPASAIVPAEPSAAAVGRPLEAAGRRP